MSSCSRRRPLLAPPDTLCHVYVRICVYVYMCVYAHMSVYMGSFLINSGSRVSFLKLRISRIVPYKLRISSIVLITSPVLLHLQCLSS